MPPLRRAMCVAGATLGLIVFTLVCRLWSEFEVPTGADAGESSDIVRALEERYAFRVMSRQDKRPAVYGSPHTRHSDVYVYGGYSAKEQEEICAAVRVVRRDTATKPIRLYFYPREFDHTKMMRKEFFE